jgi:hypothetical protein
LFVFPFLTVPNGNRQGFHQGPQKQVSSIIEALALEEFLHPSRLGKFQGHAYAKEKQTSQTVVLFSELFQIGV